MVKNRMFVVGAITVFAGYLAGVLTVLFAGGASGDYLRRFLTSQATPNWLAAFLSGPFFVLLVYFCGVFFLGWLFVFPLLYYKSYGYGYTAGLLLAGLGGRGFLPLALCLFPSAVAECLLLVCMAREALPQSVALFQSRKGDAQAFLSGLSSYLLHGLVWVQCSAFVLLWDLFLSPLILSGISEIL